MRQMEEQFTSYDFKKMQRRSYYPSNQVISTATATSSSGPASSRPVTPMTLGGDTNDGFNVNLKPHPMDDDMSDSQVPMHTMNEKGP